MKFLFLGGVWDGRAQEMDPMPHVEVPHSCLDPVSGDVTCDLFLYTAMKLGAWVPHPCVPHVSVCETWWIYQHGEEPDPRVTLGLLRRLRLPRRHFEWRADLLTGAPFWAAEVRG